MQNEHRKKLSVLVAKHSTKVCSSPGRCEALIRDFCGHPCLEINLLVTALKGGIPEEMLIPGSRSMQYIFLNMPLTLVHNHGLSKNNARWAVESWAIALGVATEKDIREFYTSEVTSKKQTSQGILSYQFNGIDFMHFPKGKYKFGSIKSLSNRNSMPDMEFEEFFISKYPVNTDWLLIFRDDNVLFKKRYSTVGRSSWSCIQELIFKIKSLYRKFRFISQFA